jgi:hypothetical protein
MYLERSAFTFTILFTGLKVHFTGLKDQDIQATGLNVPGLNVPGLNVLYPKN